MKFPTLYHKEKNGKIVKWQLWTEGTYIVRRFGQIDGKKQKIRKAAKPKNVGRSNATTAEVQAILEAKALWKNRVERKYRTSIEEAEKEVFLPMLAKAFKDPKKPIDKWGKGIIYPCDVQPKLDGVRAMAFFKEDKLILGTRNGKEWTAPKHITKLLKSIMSDKMVLDGELYVHGLDFETLSSWTKKKHPGTKTLEYHVFDMPIDAKGRRLAWKDRKKYLLALAKNFPKQIKLVSWLGADCALDILKAEECELANGYEGVMVRNNKGVYTFGHRSEHLQKVKSSMDDEFKVVGFKEGTGRDIGCVIWKCKTKEDKEFDVRPKGSQEQRREWLKKGTKYIGSYLKVRFQNWTKDNKPRFPRSIGFRDKKDM